MKNQSARNKESERPAAATEQDSLSTHLMESDSESNSSGFMSSSSFESSEEETRLVLNEQKVFDVWSKMSERVQIPKSSTPIPASEKAVLRKRVILSCESGKHMLAIKKNLTEKSKEKSKAKAELKDPFWDIPTAGLPRSYSENDIVRRSSDYCNTRDQHKRLSVPSKDAVFGNNGRKQTESQSWKRKPFLTNSDSQLQLRLCANEGRSIDNVRNISSSSYSVLPRYRVKVDSDPIVSQTKLAQHLNKSCADMDEGVPVDESMSEFLANVDRENLIGFLSFYDKMTSGDDYEKARRNRNNYEAVYC
jgi:hypothetical protein